MRGYIQIFLTGAFTCFSQGVARDSRLTFHSPIGCAIVYQGHCRSDKVQFTLFNSYYRTSGRYLDVYNPDPGQEFDPLLPVKLLIHGYNTDQDTNKMRDVTNAYLTKGNYTIIYTEWWQLSMFLCYPEAVINAHYVALCAAQLLVNLERKHNRFVAADVHAVGFSLGSHVAAYTSNYILSYTGSKFLRITGLDPAKPMIGGSLRWKHLDYTDALFVDIIHTNAGMFGRISPTGHADFYVNGGRYQGNCNDSFSFDSKGCSHTRAYVYFIESILSEDGFWGLKCLTIFHALVGLCSIHPNNPRAIMGDPASNDDRGIFYVQTNEKPPYAFGRY